MLRKKETLTVVTPIPGFIPRQLAIDILHAHSEVITLNPLVLEHRPIAAPRTAAADEFYSTCYEIVERISYLPGLGGNITFCGCFHDMPWGLQTHIYAPMNVDMRNRYRIAGNQPGVEPPDPHREIGLQDLGAPSDGLYLREDIEIKCNVALMGFVKAQIRKASKEMVQRFIKKAELLDAGILLAMMDPGGKLRTINPNDRSRPLPRLDGDAAYSPLHSPPASPSLLPLATGPYRSHPARLPYKYAVPSPSAPPVPVELPGDSSHYLPQHPATLGYRGSAASSDHGRSQTWLRPSASASRGISVSSTTGADRHPSASLARHGATAELPTLFDTTDKTLQRTRSS